MVQSKTTTANAYLAELPDERRVVIAAMRKMILKHLPKGYEESLNWGMLSYTIPLKRYPDTYNKQPLCVVALAAQKNHYALYLSCVYQCPKRLKTLQTAFKKAGKKLDMGKACVRFKKLEDLPLEAIGKLIADISVEAFIGQYEKARSSHRSK